MKIIEDNFKKYTRFQNRPLRHPYTARVLVGCIMRGLAPMLCVQQPPDLPTVAGHACTGEVAVSGQIPQG